MRVKTVTPRRALQLTRCAECGERAELSDDPRDPPMGGLCADCQEGALGEVIDELERQLDDARDALHRLNPASHYLD